jgi:para-nitrobenzyl esterase
VFSVLGLPTMNRRDFIGYSALAGAGLAFDGLLHGAAAQAVPGATVRTASGPVRGYVDNGVHVFKGVPYAASTAGPNRFLPPQKRQPWTDVRDAVHWGERSPQILGGEPAEMLPTDPREPLGEDCLVMNIWTPSPNAGRRPVMVWLHGGGFASGSGSYAIYEGRELARKHDVVSISINHRLNAFGYLYLAQFGGKWASASNVGMLDIVAALEWVRDNISAFGGDPRSVTIFGQSGGAGKVSTLMAMPAARGLFHRAIAQSGAAITAIPVDQAVKTTDQILQRLKIAPDRLDQLQTLPFAQIVDALRQMPGAAPLPAAGPVLDGRSLPAHPFDPTAPAQSAGVPFLTGTTATEVTFFATDDQLMAIDDSTLRQRVKGLLKVDDADADRLIALYRKNQPGRDNIDLFLRMSTDDSRFRLMVDTQAERKAAQRAAPVYVYRFEYYSPVRDGRLKSMHCMEIPFVFDNLEAGRVYTGISAAAQRIADRMSAAWVAFARTGNPNHRGIPQWPAFNSTSRPTMVFGDETKMVNDPGREERLALKAIRERQTKATA